MRKHFARFTVAGAAMLAYAGIAHGQDNNSPSAQTVDPSRPFGALDIGAAGTTAEQVGAFASGLSGKELIELIGRCDYILAASGGMGMGSVSPEMTGATAMGVDPNDATGSQSGA
jgi:hypothetical protein